MRAAKWLQKTIDIEYSNLNYAVANAYAMALLGRVLGEARYTAQGHELARASLACFTPRDLLLSGEGGKPGATSKKSCHPVDLGDNVEESLPSLVLYGLLENDSVVLNQVATSLQAHA